MDWKPVAAHVLSVLEQYLVKQKSGVLDNYNYLLKQIISEIGGVKLSKRLQVFGSGLLNEKKKEYHPPDEVLFYQLGKMLAALIEAKLTDQEHRLQQMEQVAKFQTIKKLQEIRQLEPEGFEYWTAGYFEQFGFQDVAVTSFSGDFGVDVYMTCANKKRAIVQCKQYNGSVGRPTIQQTYGIMKLLEMDVCYVVTTGQFTQAALALGKNKDIVLLDGEFLASGKRPPGSKRQKLI